MEVEGEERAAPPAPRPPDLDDACAWCGKPIKVYQTAWKGMWTVHARAVVANYCSDAHERRGHRDPAAVYARLGKRCPPRRGRGA